MLTKPELSIILASLRLWQESISISEELYEIADNGGIALDHKAIDDLCERLNMASSDTIERVENLLRIRNKNRLTQSEADFIAGAMSVMITGTKFPEEIPPWWVLGPMSGRPLLKDAPPPYLEIEL